MNFTGSYFQFDLRVISVGQQPIQLWFEKPDGSVWGWSELAANTLHFLNTGPARIAWVSGSANATGSYKIDYWVADTL